MEEIGSVDAKDSSAPQLLAVGAVCQSLQVGLTGIEGQSALLSHLVGVDARLLVASSRTQHLHLFLPETNQ